MADANIVAGPQARRAGVNLLSSVQVPTDTADIHWSMPIAWEPEECIDAQGFNFCGDLSTAPNKSNTGALDYWPQAFRVERECTLLNGRSLEREMEALRRQAEAATSYQVARELWTGELSVQQGVADANTNLYLTNGNATLVTTSATAIADKLAALEAAALAKAKDQQVYLHVPAGVVLSLGNLLTKVGDVLYTPLGSIVVTDGGYPSAPNGNAAAATSEAQTVTITGAPTGGTFTLTYAGQTTTAIVFNATAAQVQAALEALPNISVGDVVVTGGPGPGTPWVVTFAPSLGNVAQMTATGSFTGGTTPAIAVTTTTGGAARSYAAGTWAYATGPVQVRLAPVQTDSPDPAPNMDLGARVTNRWTLYAERAFAISFSPCIHLSVQLA